MKKIEKKDIKRLIYSLGGPQQPGIKRSNEDRRNSEEIWRATIQGFIWSLIIGAMPIATYLSTRDAQATKTSFLVVWDLLKSPLVVFFSNYYFFGPYLFFKRRYWMFVFCNLCVIYAMNAQFFSLYLHRDSIPNMPEMSSEMWIGFFSGLLMFLLLNCMVAAIAIGIRHFIRMRDIKQQLKDEKAKNTEAELAWLKNQINPHFLFNTLNNISSLTQIDPDAAQDAIAQLSDLLRYAMYETNKKTVPIQGEVEFMRNYISLMKLRCNEKTEVTTTFSVKQPSASTPDSSKSMEIAPLLFISLIENAFKHGVSSNRPSKIDIHLEQTDDQLVFTCKNTNYPKDDADRSGSGIGLENTRRRLDLMYADRYTWQQYLDSDIYHVRIALNV